MLTTSEIEPDGASVRTGTFALKSKKKAAHQGGFSNKQ